MKTRWVTVLTLVIVSLVVVAGACTRPAPSPAPKPPASQAPAPGPGPKPSPAPAPKPSPAPAPSPKTAPAPTAAAAFKWPATLTLVVAGVGTTGYIATAAWAPVMEQKTGARVRIVPEDDRAVQHRLLRTGEVDIAGIVSSDFGNLIEAKDVHASREGGPYRFGVAWVNAPVTMGFIVKKDSNIKTVYDIKPGLKVAYFATPGGRQIMDALLAWVGLSRKDVKVVEFSTFADSTKSIMDERADVAFTSMASPAAYEVAAGPRGVRVLELPADKDPAGAARFLDVLPVASFGPATSATIKEGLGVKTFHQPIPYLTRAETDPNLVYNMAKWLDENHDTYKAKHETLQDYNLSGFMGSIANQAFVPLHEGTIKYLREKGVWTPALEARQKYNVDLLTKYINAYKTAVSRAEAQGINITPRENKWVELWEAYKKELGLPRIKVMLEIPK